MGVIRELAPRSFDNQERAEAGLLQITFESIDGQKKVFLQLHQDVSAGISGVLYDGALLLAATLVQSPDLLPQHATVLELGCGTGCVGLVAKSLGASVICTDRSLQSLSLTERSAAENGIQGLRCVRWDWHDPIPQDCAGCKLILASDAVYSEKTANALLSAIVAAAGEHSTVLLLLKARCPNGAAGIRALLSKATLFFGEVMPLPLQHSKIIVQRANGSSLSALEALEKSFYLYSLRR